MYKEKEFNKLIKEICMKNDISYQELSDDWIIKLKKNNMIRFIIGYKFDLNTQAISDICNDKFALYSVLKSEGIPVIEYNILFKNEMYKLKGIFEKYGEDVVIKPNNGTCGNDVLHIKELNELENEYKRISGKCSSVNICPFYDIENEYRIIYLKNKKYMYKKVKPIIIGDGRRNVKELLVEFNSAYYSSSEHLNNKNIYENYVPKFGEKIEYEWRFNLSRGAKVADVSLAEKCFLEDIADKITTLFDFKFVSIDVVKTKKNEVFVMEINSGVMMENLIKQKNDGRDIAREIYENAVLEMFEV